MTDAVKRVFGLSNKKIESLNNRSILHYIAINLECRDQAKHVRAGMKNVIVNGKTLKAMINSNDFSAGEFMRACIKVAGIVANIPPERKLSIDEKRAASHRYTRQA